MSIASNVTAVIVSSAVVAAVVGALSSFVTQRYLLVKKAQIDSDAMERKALLDYQSLARQHLMEAIGPLRMQLLFGAREAVHRVNSHVRPGIRWNMDPAEDYVRSTVYRILRPLAVAQLIENAMGTADFTVDAEAVDLLRFGTAAERLLSSGDIVLNHPKVDWARQAQHLFRDNLRAAAARLINEDQSRPIVIGFERFQEEVPDLSEDRALAALGNILGACRGSMTENPILWLRLVGYAYACRELIRDQGLRIGFALPALDPEDLLQQAKDDHIAQHADEYVAAIRKVIEEGL